MHESLRRGETSSICYNIVLSKRKSLESFPFVSRDRRESVGQLAINGRKTFPFATRSTEEYVVYPSLPRGRSTTLLTCILACFSQQAVAIDRKRECDIHLEDLSGVVLVLHIAAYIIYSYEGRIYSVL